MKVKKNEINKLKSRDSILEENYCKYDDIWFALEGINAKQYGSYRGNVETRVLGLKVLLNDLIVSKTKKVISRKSVSPFSSFIYTDGSR